MAQIIATPNPSATGRPVTIVGQGFAATTEVTFEISPGGFRSEIVSTGGGAVSTSGIADHATVTLTSTGNAVAGETLTLGSVTYTFRATAATMTAANDILIGAAATNTYDNIVAAVNGDPAGRGSLYFATTPPHPTVYAGAKTATTVVFYARQPGAAGNSIASTETMTVSSFGAGTLTGGASAAAQSMLWVPSSAGMFTVTATDGTNTASPITVQIYTT